MNTTITVLRQEDPDRDHPIYQGTVDDAATILPNGVIYQVSEIERDGIIEPDPKVAVVVNGGSAFLIPVVEVDHIGAEGECVAEERPAPSPVTPRHRIAYGREFGPMITVEVAERLATRALAVLADPDVSKDDAVSHAKTLLAALIVVTSNRTATEVKVQADSDAISGAAAITIAGLVEHTFDGTDIHFANAYSRLDGRYHL